MLGVYISILGAALLRYYSTPVMPEITIENPNSCPFKYFQPHKDLYLQYTTRQFWSLKRNVQVDDGDTHPSDAKNEFPLFIYSYQKADSPEVEFQVQKAVKVLAQGRDGKLLSWQKETSIGIEDTSGLFTLWRELALEIFS